MGSSFWPKPEPSIYDGSLKAENLIYWISEMDKYFEYEDIDENKRVKFVATRLKGTLHYGGTMCRMKEERRTNH